MASTPPQLEHILLSRRGRALTLMLNRPDRLNAFNARLHTEIVEAIGFAANDPDSDVIILTGAGRAFSAGGDIDWQLEAANHAQMFEGTVREARQIIFGLIDLEKPLITRLNGPAVGLGATIALFGDVIFAAKSAYVSDPHVSVGMVAGDGGAVIWPQLIGYARAKEYLLTGDKISAEEAERIGLINHAVADEALDEAVDAFVDRLLAGAQLALRYTKATVNVGLRQLAASIMDVGLGYESMTNVTSDHREALLAFREKRPPKFGRTPS